MIKKNRCIHQQIYSQDTCESKFFSLDMTMVPSPYITSFHIVESNVNLTFLLYNLKYKYKF